MQNYREIKVIVNYVELDGTKMHMVRDVQFQPEGDIAGALTTYLAEKHNAKFVNYIVLVPAW